MKGTKLIGNSTVSFILLVFSIVVFLFCNQAFGAIPASQRAALIALYNSTNGDNWYSTTGWKTPPLDSDGFAMPGTENTWTGITCNAANTTVVEIYLYQKNLRGNLPPEIGNLPNLQSLNLSDNYFSGAMPPELANLTNLQSLIFHSSGFTGNIPPELGNLSNLKVLNFSVNHLTGSIPPELSNLGNLQTLDLNVTHLSGNIPPEFGNLSNLKTFKIYSSYLTGSIPPELGNLINLQSLDISCSALTGSIPPELGNLTNLKSLDISCNSLTGSIPPELGNMNALQTFILYANKISGSIPPELGNLNNLRVLIIHTPRISGTIPPELGNLDNLRTLNLDTPRISGSIPGELGNLTNLTNLYLNGNGHTGSIPPELGNLSLLEYLDLSSNKLSGSIPPELGNLSNLYELYLYKNKLSGSIPSAIGNLTNLSILSLDGNRLSGPLPASLQNLVNLGQYGSIHYFGISLCWNSLYTDNDALINFIREHHSDGCFWEENQTVPPVGLNASPAGNNAINLKWTPIAYEGDPGGYLVFYSTAAGGPFEFFGKTANKSASSLKITGLKARTKYYFKIKTRTDSHSDNRNTLESGFSRVVSASTSTTDPDPAELFPISGTVTYQGGGIPGVTLTLSNNGGTVTTGAKGYYYARVKQGWSGTTTPTKKNFMFSPAQRTYAEVSAEKTNQDFTAIIPVTLHIGAERKTERAFIISRDYAVITLSMENENNIPGIRCVLERKLKGGIFQPIKEFAGTELSGGAYVYTDKFLDRDKSYTYRLSAYDSQGNYLVSSGEATINNLQQGLLEGVQKNEGTSSKER